MLQALYGSALLHCATIIPPMYLSSLELPASKLPALGLSWAIGAGSWRQDVCPVVAMLSGAKE